MYQLTKFGVVILTAAALLCWAAPTLAGPTVPYKDSVEGTTDLTFTGPLTAIQTVDGTFGVATHLGRVQVSGQHTLTFDASPGPGVTGTVTNGHITYTAADGSTIDADYEGSFVIVSTNPPLLLFSLQAVFSNGTDRLEGVTGEADIDVTGHLGSFTYTSDGTLTYPDRP